jgi:hypothetical protein
MINALALVRSPNGSLIEARNPEHGHFLCELRCSMALQHLRQGHVAHAHGRVARMGMPRRRVQQVRHKLAPGPALSQLGFQHDWQQNWMQVVAQFMPSQLAEITEPAAQRMAQRLQRTPVAVPSLPEPTIDTAYVGPTSADKQRHAAAGRPPVVLLHGFDSSCLEFRRLYPLLEQETEAWAVDLVRA